MRSVIAFINDRDLIKLYRESLRLGKGESIVKVLELGCESDRFLLMTERETGRKSPR
jgi:hypothetical protein